MNRDEVTAAVAQGWTTPENENKVMDEALATAIIDKVMAIPEWGPGEVFKPFDTVRLGGRDVELGWGEHPHSTQDNTMYVRTHDGTIYGFDGHRRQVSVRLDTSNYLKESELSGDEVRKSCEARILIDGKVARVIDGRDPRDVLLRCHRALGELFEMGNSVFNDGEKLLGRKIYYGQTPAVIERIMPDSAELYIVPEKGLVFDPSPWALEDGQEAVADWLADYGGGMRVKDNDPSIWWWRNG
jgi:hypothetical protein